MEEVRGLILQVGREVVLDYTITSKKYWEEMTNKYHIEDAKIEPMVFLVANDNWLEFSLRYIVDYKLRRVTKDKLFTRILEEIDKSHGRIIVASMTVDVVGFPATVKSNN